MNEANNFSYEQKVFLGDLGGVRSPSFMLGNANDSDGQQNLSFIQTFMFVVECFLNHHWWQLSQKVMRLYNFFFSFTLKSMPGLLYPCLVRFGNCPVVD